MGSKNLIVRKTQNGKGVFANKDFKKNEFILEFRGDLYTSEELPTPYNKTEDRYMQIGENLYIGPSGDIDDFLNHSCDPNSGVKINGKKVFLIAIKEIKKNEEITWDYSTTMDEDDWEMNCNCGSKSCRGRIRDFKYLPSDIQKKYLDLGIVPEYIQKNLQNYFAVKEGNWL